MHGVYALKQLSCLNDQLICIKFQLNFMICKYNECIVEFKLKCWLAASIKNCSHRKCISEWKSIKLSIAYVECVYEAKINKHMSIVSNMHIYTLYYSLYNMIYKSIDWDFYLFNTFLFCFCNFLCAVFIFQIVWFSVTVTYATNANKLQDEKNSQEKYWKKKNTKKRTKNRNQEWIRQEKKKQMLNSVSRLNGVLFCVLHSI